MTSCEVVAFVVGSVAFIGALVMLFKPGPARAQRMEGITVESITARRGVLVASMSDGRTLVSGEGIIWRDPETGRWDADESRRLQDRLEADRIRARLGGGA